MTDTENTKYKNYLKLCKHLASFLLSIEFYYTRFFEMGRFCFVMFFFPSLFCIAFIDRLSTGAVVGAMMERGDVEEKELFHIGIFRIFSCYPFFIR